MNVQGLYDTMTERMCGLMGQPRAYWEIEPEHEGWPHFRLVYKVYEIGIEAATGDTFDYEALLCDVMLKRFDQTQTDAEREDHAGTLIWRRQPRYDCAPVVKWNQDADEGRGNYVPIDPPRTRHTLSIRVYCPRIDKIMQSKQEGLETSEWLEPRS
jgi:hypothetical protein